MPIGADDAVRRSPGQPAGMMAAAIAAAHESTSHGVVPGPQSCKRGACHGRGSRVVNARLHRALSWRDHPVFADRSGDRRWCVLARL